MLVDNRSTDGSRRIAEEYAARDPRIRVVENGAMNPLPVHEPHLVSVVVPTYNRAYCLERALRSALSQTHKVLEIIVIDDGSTDGTPALVRDMQASDGRIRYVRQANRGVSASRNVGLRLAQGEYVAFLDSDDVWRPWKIALQLRAMQRLPDVGMVWTDMEAIDPKGRVISERYIRQMYTTYRRFPTEKLFTRCLEATDWLSRDDSQLPRARLYAGDIYSAMVTGSLVHTSTVLVKRDWALRTGGFPEEKRTGEDYDFHLRTCRLGQVAFIDLTTISYQRGMPDRLTRPELGAAMALSFLKTLEETLAHDADRITLSRRMIRSVRAEANRWVGGILFGEGRYRDASPYLAASLRREFMQPMAWAQWVVCQFPPRWANALVTLRRRLAGRGS